MCVSWSHGTAGTGGCTPLRFGCGVRITRGEIRSCVCCGGSSPVCLGVVESGQFVWDAASGPLQREWAIRRISVTDGQAFVLFVLADFNLHPQLVLHLPRVLPGVVAGGGAYTKMISR
jgi:hypothetical protein